MKLTLALLFFFIFSIFQAYSWGGTGHMLTAQIAKNELLNSDPEAYKVFEEIVLAINSLTDGRSSSFVEAACWSDDIKGSKMNFMNDWHYIDRNYNMYGLDATGVYHETNALYALNQSFAVLNAYNSGNLVGQSIMARVLLHIIGDIHQPLHSVAMINYEFPNGDRGGNSVKIYYKGKKSNLHYLWDDGLLEWDYVSRPLNNTGLNYIQEEAESIVKEYPRSSLEEELKLGLNFEKWTLESYQLAQSNTYNGVWNATKTKYNDRTISQEYIDTNVPIVKQRIALGGYRLADTISNYVKERKANLEMNNSKENENRSFLK